MSYYTNPGHHYHRATAYSGCGCNTGAIYQQNRGYGASKRHYGKTALEIGSSVGIGSILAFGAIALVIVAAMNKAEKSGSNIKGAMSFPKGAAWEGKMPI